MVTAAIGIAIWANLPFLSRIIAKRRTVHDAARVSSNVPNIGGCPVFDHLIAMAVPSKKSAIIVMGRYTHPVRPLGKNEITERVRHMARAE
jgi:hypothetical protein